MIPIREYSEPDGTTHKNLFWASIVQSPTRTLHIQPIGVKVTKSKVDKDRSVVLADQDIGPLDIFVANIQRMEGFDSV